MKACSCASLRNCNETETRIGAARDIGPVTVSPACNAAACATTLVPAGAAAQANEPTASPKPTTKLFNRNMFDIEISSKCTKWDRACRHSRATPEQSGYRPISLDHIGLITRASTHKAEARRFEDRLRAPSHEQANAR